MKSLIGLLLMLSMALPACSAEDGTSATTEPVANVETAELPKVAPTPAAEAVNTPPAKADTEQLVAEVRDPAPAVKVSAPAARPDIVAGRHYRILTPAQGTSSSPDKIEVAEVFMYSCPHCRDLEPFIKSYLRDKPNYVSFVRIPASFNRIAREHARAYYMAETLGVIEDVHMDIFTEFHTRRNQLATEPAIIDFFIKRGVARDDVTEAYNSFPVDTKMRQADNLVRRYGIASVPTLVINGKYVTSASMTGSFDKLRDVVEYLTAKEAAQL